jgi:hypothetical protein
LKNTDFSALSIRKSLLIARRRSEISSTIKRETYSGGLALIGTGGRIGNMNTQPLEMLSDVDNTVSDTDVLTQLGFSQDEIISVLWLRQWYQHGGSDRVEVLRHLEFLKLLVVNGKIEL